MSQSSAQLTPTATSGGSHVDNSSDGDFGRPTPPVSVRSSGTAATLVDHGLTWSKIISPVHGGRTIHATAQIIRGHVDDRHSITCTARVQERDPETYTYFHFGTQDGSLYAECRSASAVQGVVPDSTAIGAAHSKAIYALIKAIEEPAVGLFKSLDKRWGKNKRELVKVLEQIDNKIRGALENPGHPGVWGWLDIRDSDAAAPLM